MKYASLPPLEHDFARVPTLLRWVGLWGLRALGWRLGELPPSGVDRGVVVAAPHTSNWDFVFALFGLWAFGIQMSFMGKEQLFRPPLGWLLRSLGGISVDRTAPRGQVAEVADLLQSTPGMLLLVPAEGTRRYRASWKSGFYWIALEAGVPVVTTTLDYGQRIVGFGPLVELSGDVGTDMDVMRAIYRGRTGRFPDEVADIRLRAEDTPAP